MNKKKFLSLFLAALMLCSVLTSFSVIAVSAEETTTAPSEEETEIDYTTQVYATPEDKLATMKLMTTKGNYQIYADEKSGEVAVKDLRSGQVMFTNPYDVGAANASTDKKYEVLSQIIVKYTENGRDKEYSSFEYAALRDQIKVKNIKNGIRVEYTIGREEARRLVPRMIRQDRFEELILKPVLEYYDNDENNFYYRQFKNYYQLKGLEFCASDRLKADLLAAFPIVAKMNVYVFDPTATVTEQEKREETIKTACPNYSYEEMDYDHQLTEYVSEDENPPVFKMALEYTLESDGFSVRLPTNGLRFDESKFQVTDLEVLPFMGAGNNNYEGYTFYPDGSGALFAFEDLKDVGTKAVSNKVYGADYAYHKISGNFQQAIRYPVFGIMEKTRYYDCQVFDEKLGETVTTRINGMIYDALVKAQEDGNTMSPLYKEYGALLSSEITEVVEDRGFVAIIEEGDALTQLVNYHAGVLYPYDTVKMNFNPRPQDSYNIADAISVGSNKEWTVVSNRKYVGNYKVHYIMLTDEGVAAEKQIPENEFYKAGWLGMAFAYRDYLENKGLLQRLTAEQTSGDVPLYIESFGSLKTVEKILSIPVSVKKPLTSTEDVVTMYEELSKAGATNINFKLTGYANGGMFATMPYNLKWEKAVSEDMTMQELFDYAAGLESGELGLFPEFDFSYVTSEKMFDGLSLRKHAVKTIDDRYTSKRMYSATQQKYDSYYQLAISPAYFSHFYEKLMSKYLGYDNVSGISVGSLGNSLNSDFDEDEPYNREDSKSFVKKALSYIKGEGDSALEVMVDGGNAYTWQYADHILGASVDSSHYIIASYSVPFLGVVLHGYTNFTGSPLNMEGDLNYAKLKAMENGASVYFTLSYQNTQNLKENKLLSQYYSIRYDIWFDDVVELYNELNSNMKDLQDKIIVDHQFLTGMRVPDTDELKNDIDSEFDSVLDFQNNKAEYEEKQKAEAVADARDQIASFETAAQSFVSNCLSYYSGMNGAAYLYVSGERSFERRFATSMEANAAYDAIKAKYDAADDAGKKELADLLASAEGTKKQADRDLNTYIRNISRAIASLEKEYATLTRMLEDAKSGALLIGGTEGCPQSIIDEIEAQINNATALMQEQLGIKFDLTVDKAEVDTFLHTHIAMLIFSCYGTDTYKSVGTVGKAENLYKMLTSGEYGLMMSELELLRYLPENKNMTDDELAKKYGLASGKTSMDGLVLYVTELLGDGYVFDPVLTDTADGIEKHIRNYYVNLLFTMVNGLSDGSTVPALNFVPNRYNVETGKLIGSNQENINKVTNALKTTVDKALMSNKDVMARVENGDYTLSKIYSEDEMNKLVAELVAYVEEQSKATAKTPVKYATPETLEKDLRNFIEGLYYKAVIAQQFPGAKTSLQVLKVTSTTASSIELMVSLKLDEYDECETYQEVYAKLMADETIADSIKAIAASLPALYGDVTEELMASYYQTFAKILLGNSKTPDFACKASSDTKKLKEAVAALIASKGEIRIEEIDTFIAELVALTAEYTMKDGVDVETTASHIAYHTYLAQMAAKTSVAYYYDEQMATMDTAIATAVAAKKAELEAMIAEGASVYDVYDLVFNSLADSENPVSKLAADIAASVPYTAEGKYTVAGDVLAKYCYMLFNSFDGYVMPEDEPTINLSCNSAVAKEATRQIKKDVANRVTALLAEAKANTARGESVNYALSALRSEEELTTIANEIMDYLIDSLFADENEREFIVPELIEYIKHVYTTEALEKVDADKAPSFHISEVYGNTLATATADIKALLRYYVTTFTTTTDEDIDKMIGGSKGNIGDEEDEETSRYVSDDGRIVAVTYGDRANGGYSKYKTFVLNYNNFSVNVVYENVTYTIPAYGYVVVMN